MQEEHDSTQNDQLFLEAIERGDIDVVKVFLADELFDPAANKKKAIVVANQNKKNIKILELLVFNDRANPDPYDSFIWAVGCGHTKLVELLLTHPVVSPGCDENNAFNLAITKGHRDVIRLLLNDDRVDPTANNQRAIFLAYQTIRNKNTAILTLLLLNKRANPNSNSLFLSAVNAGHTATVKLLLDYGKVNLITQDTNGIEWKAIKLAGEKGYTQILMLFNPTLVFTWAIQNGFDEIVKLMIPREKLELESAVVLAAEFGDLVTLRLLLAKKQIYLSGDGSARAINKAALNGHYEIVEELLRDGRVKPYGAIVEAVNGKHHKIVQMLLRNQRVVAYKQKNKSVFLFLIKKNDAESLTILLKNGCIEDSRIKVQALRDACDHKNIEIINSLLIYGDINIETKQKLFLISCKRQDIVVIGEFLKNNCVDNSVAEQEFQSACKNGHLEIVKSFFKNKSINPWTINKGFQIACQNGHAEIVNIFLSSEQLDFHVDHPAGFLEAYTNGCADIVNLLLAHPKPKNVFSSITTFFNSKIELAVDPTDADNAAIKKVAELGHVDVMKVLLKDPRINQEVKCEAMHIAAKNNCTEVVKLLLEDPQIPLEIKNEALRITAEKRDVKTFAVSACYKIGFFDQNHVKFLGEEEALEDVCKKIRYLTIAATIQKPK